MKKEILSSLIKKANIYYNNPQIRNCSCKISAIQATCFENSDAQSFYNMFGLKCLRFVKTYYPSDYERISNIFYTQEINTHHRIREFLFSYEDFPEEIVYSAKDDKNVSVSINQNQHNNFKLNILIDIISNSLSAEQLSEIKDILKSPADEKVKKDKVLGKIVALGSDVASNILANILTNPNIYNLI